MINLMNSLKEKYPSVTHADMYQLASALAIEVGSWGLACLAPDIWNSCEPVSPPYRQSRQAAVFTDSTDCRELFWRPCSCQDWRNLGQAILHVMCGAGAKLVCLLTALCCWRFTVACMYLLRSQSNLDTAGCGRSQDSPAFWACGCARGEGVRQGGQAAR